VAGPYDRVTHLVRLATPIQYVFEVPSRFAIDITSIDQHPTDACTSTRPRALIEGPDKTRVR
jgi:hypothetical protein